MRPLIVVGFVAVQMLGCSSAGPDEHRAPNKKDIGTSIAYETPPLKRDANFVVEHEMYSVPVAPEKSRLAWGDWFDDRCHQGTPSTELVMEGVTEPVDADFEVSPDWVVAEFCSEATDGPVRDIHQGIKTSAVLSDGRLVLAVENPIRGNLSRPGLSYVSSIDATTGSALLCTQLGDFRGYTSGVYEVKTSSGSEPVLVFDSPKIRSETGDVPAEFGWWSPEFQPELFTRERPRIAEGVMLRDSQLRQDGQLISIWADNSLTSIDARTGRFNWAVSALDFAEATDPNTHFELSFVDGSESIKLGSRLGPNGQSMAVFATVDNCGGFQLIDGNRIRLWSHEGINLHHVDFRQYELEFADGSSERVSGPRQIVEAERGLVIVHNGGRLTHVSSDGVREVEIFSSSKFDNRFLHDIEGVTVSAGGILIVSYLRFDERFEDVSAGLAFVEQSSMAVVKVQPLGPVTKTSTRGGNPPFVLSDGRIITEMHGKIWGVRTSLEGLAPTRFPRGIRYGRNGNVVALGD